MSVALGPRPVAGQAELETPRYVGLPCKYGVTRWNLLAIVFTPLVLMLLQTYLNAQVVLLLSTPGLYDIPVDAEGNREVGKYAGELISYSLPPAVVATFLVGYVYDIVGRKLTLYVSFAIASTLMYFIPLTAPTVFPNLLLLRMGIAVAIVPPVASPLVADYLAKEAIGKGAALIGIGFIIGEILSMAVLFNITKHMTPQAGFLTVAIIGNVIALSFLFIVKEPVLRKAENEISREEAREQNIRRMSTVNRQDISQISTGESSSETGPSDPVPSTGYTEEAFKSLSFFAKMGVLTK